jgi:glutamate dehydrogenase (NAD(P)+)
MKAIGMTVGLKDKTVVIQGLGNVGYYAAKFMEEEGCKIIAIAELEGAIHDPNGLDVMKLVKHRKDTGSILNFPGATNIAISAAALELECDILIPAALENQITEENAPRIKAKIIGEAANGPVTPQAEEILLENGCLIIPDMYLNAGGVTVSYFEWLKNLSHVRFGRMQKRADESTYNNIIGTVERLTGRQLGEKERGLITRGADEIDIVNSGLEETMIEAYRQIREVAKKHKDMKSMRTAAFVVAIQKISEAYMAMGIFP